MNKDIETFAAETGAGARETNESELQEVAGGYVLVTYHHDAPLIDAPLLRPRAPLFPNGPDTKPR